MAILDYGNLSINGTVISYEGAVKIEPGTKKRIVSPQVNGGKIITTDISTNVSKITVKVRVTTESNSLMPSLIMEIIILSLLETKTFQLVC